MANTERKARKREGKQFQRKQRELTLLTQRKAYIQASDEKKLTMIEAYGYSRKEATLIMMHAAGLIDASVLEGSR